MLGTIRKRLLKVFYNTQRDNKIDPFRTCFPTSVAMVIRSLEALRTKPRPQFMVPDLDDYFIQDIENNVSSFRKKTVEIVGSWAAKFHPRMVFGFWKWYLEKRIGGYSVRLLKDPSFLTLCAEINKNNPVIVNTHLNNLQGHIVVVTGYEGQYAICNDPFGDANTKYKTTNGKSIYYIGQTLCVASAMVIEIKE